jgi:hypothetical protein
MSAFATAVDLLFADPNLAAEAIWQPADGEPFPVRVIARRADEVIGFGEAQLWSEAAKFDVRVAEVPSPHPGDRLLVGAETYLVQGEPVRDRERLIWTLNTRPA